MSTDSAVEPVDNPTTAPGAHGPATGSGERVGQTVAMSLNTNTFYYPDTNTKTNGSCLTGSSGLSV
jgi:hypothetical protein